MFQQPSGLPYDLQRDLALSAFGVWQAFSANRGLFDNAPGYVWQAFSECDPLTPFVKFSFGPLTPNDAMRFSGYGDLKGKLALVPPGNGSADYRDSSRGIYGGSAAATEKTHGLLIASCTSGLQEKEDLAISLVTLWQAEVIDENTLYSGNWGGDQESLPYIKSLVHALKMRTT